MAPESIIDKARKILALAEGGQDGEVIAAKDALENLLKKYGLTIEDIRHTKRTQRKFKICNSAEKSIFVHCLLKMFGRDDDVLKSACSYKRDPALYADMSDVEFIEFTPFFEFHVRGFRKERSKLLKNIASAYVNKHDLFDAKDDGVESDSDNIDWEEVYQVMKLSDTMESAFYFKEIAM